MKNTRNCGHWHLSSSSLLSLDHLNQFSLSSRWFCSLPDHGSDTSAPCTLYLKTIVCTVDLGTCNHSFRSVLSSLDFTIQCLWPSLMGVLNKPCYHGPWKKHHLLSVRFSQKKVRGHATKNIWLTQPSIITRIDSSGCCMYIFGGDQISRRFLVTFLSCKTSIMEPNFMNVFGFLSMLYDFWQSAN